MDRAFGERGQPRVSRSTRAGLDHYGDRAAAGSVQELGESCRVPALERNGNVCLHFVVSPTHPTEQWWLILKVGLELVRLERRSSLFCSSCRTGCEQRKQETQQLQVSRAVCGSVARFRVARSGLGQELGPGWLGGAEVVVPISGLWGGAEARWDD